MPFLIHQKITFPVPVSQDMTSHHFKIGTFMLHLEGWAHKAWDPSKKWCSVSPKIVYFTCSMTFRFQLRIYYYFLHLSIVFQRQKGSSFWFEACKSTELIAWTSVILYYLTVFTCSRKHRPFTRWFKYDRDWFVCKQAALRSSCATLREW